jgi:2-amino-4-hydroxy-6-hydroxymethyldihydropteridine diphosphokinase
MRAVLALGSNLGARESILSSAAEALNEIGEVIALSNFLDNRPVGGPPQPNFLNAVLILETELEPEELLRVCQAIEGVFGRTRDAQSERWGPRTLDVDLISCDNLTYQSESLILPHPRAAERPFVLTPWLEVDSAAYLPGVGPVAELLAKLSRRDTL